MVRGCQKKVVFLKNTGSEFFEEAYFVLCDGDVPVGEGDMISEANRMIEEMRCEKVKKKERFLTKEKICSFLSGFALSALASLIIILAVL